MSRWGQCYSCDEMASIDVGKDGLCTEVCPDRIKTEDGYCVVSLK